MPSFARLVRRRGLDVPTVTLVTQTLVDRADPAFARPDKPIGSFLDEATARRLERQLGWTVMLDGDRGWRRSISVLGAPTLPLQPVSPRRTLIMVLSIPAGVFLGIALAIFLYGLSDKIQRPRDLATIEGLAYLGTFDLRRPSASQ